MDLRLSPLDALPLDLGELVEVSLADGYDFVLRLQREWDDGANRFDQPGEVLLEARLGARLVGMGGLNRDPYVDDPRIGRIRHVYVHPEARRSGVGRALLEALVAHAHGSFQRVRLRTYSEDADRFYESLGFVSSGREADATHNRILT